MCCFPRGHSARPQAPPREKEQFHASAQSNRPSKGPPVWDGTVPVYSSSEGGTDDDAVSSSRSSRMASKNARNRAEGESKRNRSPSTTVLTTPTSFPAHTFPSTSSHSSGNADSLPLCVARPFDPRAKGDGVVVLSQSAASRAYAGTYERVADLLEYPAVRGFCGGQMEGGAGRGRGGREQQGWEAEAGGHNFMRHVDMQCSQALCSANLRHMLPPPSTPTPSHLSAPSSSSTLNGSLSMGHKTGRASAAGGYGAYGGNRQRSPVLMPAEDPLSPTPSHPPTLLPNAAGTRFSARGAPASPHSVYSPYFLNAQQARRRLSARQQEAFSPVDTNLSHSRRGRDPAASPYTSPATTPSQFSSVTRDGLSQRGGVQQPSRLRESRASQGQGMQRDSSGQSRMLISGRQLADYIPKRHISGQN